MWLLWLLFILLSSLHIASAGNKRCLALLDHIKKAHYFYFGIDFPYWFAVGQAEKESLCRHGVTSKDGIGSEGFAQITFFMWKDKLAQEGIYEIKSIPNHARAQAFINFTNYKASYCKKLWEVFQRYNGGNCPTDDAKLSACDYNKAQELCYKGNPCCCKNGKTFRRGYVCVYRVGNECLQYRHACEINYSYSLLIYTAGLKYNLEGKTTPYKFW